MMQHGLVYVAVKTLMVVELKFLLELLRSECTEALDAIHWLESTLATALAKLNENL